MVASAAAAVISIGYLQDARKYGIYFQVRGRRPRARKYIPYFRVSWKYPIYPSAYFRAFFYTLGSEKSGLRKFFIIF